MQCCHYGCTHAANLPDTLNFDIFKCFLYLSYCKKLALPLL